jgi:hypothetical protein
MCRYSLTQQLVGANACLTIAAEARTPRRQKSSNWSGGLPGFPMYFRNFEANVAAGIAGRPQI